MKPLIITNNPRVYDEFSPAVDTEYHEAMPQEEILRLARDRIHLGAKLIIHPMMGRIRPHETPYKSVFLEVPAADGQRTDACAADNGHRTGDNPADDGRRTEACAATDIHPAETPATDFTSVQIIEDSIAETRKFLENTYMKKYDEGLLKDLQYIDFLLIKEGIEEYSR